MPTDKNHGFHWENVPVIYISLDDNGAIKKTNAFTRDFFQSDPRGKKLCEFFPPTAVKQLNDARKKTSEQPIMLNITDGRDRPHSMLFQLSQPGGSTTIAGFPDIRGHLDMQTQVLELNHQLGVAQRNLQKANAGLESKMATLNQFLGMAVHDMRNPLNIINMYSTLLKDAVPGSDCDSLQMLQGIRDACIFMDSLISDFLSTSVIESGKLVLYPSKFSLNGLLETAIRFNRFFSLRKKIELAFQDNGSPEIRADSQKIQQVFNNLISNAVHHAPEGTAVSVTLDNRGKMVSVSIKNPSQPLSKSDIRTLFLPYVRGKRNQSKKGAGLGLAICKTIIDLHGGTIKAKSFEDTFEIRVCLPLKSA